MKRGVSGRHWIRPERECPAWCGGGHHCTARHDYPSGEHRSRPLTVARRWGAMVVTRVLAIGGRGRLEIRLQVNLAASETVAHGQAAQVAEEIDLAVQSALLTAGWLDIDEPYLLGLAGP